MKKLIIVLMMVAMASFLFVGCLSGTTTPATTTTTTTTTTTPATVAPIIIAVDAGALVNKAEAANGIVVNGTGRTYAEIKLSIGGILVSSGDVAVNGTWTIVVAKTELGADGAKVLTATATEPGLTESAKSNEVKFTLDTAYPTIKSVKARAGVQFVNTTVLPTVAVLGGGTIPVPVATLALSGTGLFILAPGAWTVVCTNIPGAANNVVITSPAGVATQYTGIAIGAQAADWGIPGLTLTFAAGFVSGDACTITVVGGTAEVRGRVSLAFDEDVSFTQATGGNYTIFNNTWPAYDILGVLGVTAFMAYNETTDTMFWQERANWGAWDLVQGDFLTFQLDGITDVAGNPIPVGTPQTTNTVVLASTIAIAP